MEKKKLTKECVNVLACICEWTYHKFNPHRDPIVNNVLAHAVNFTGWHLSRVCARLVEEGYIEQGKIFDEKGEIKTGVAWELTQKEIDKIKAKKK
jgi:hypothetical protein